jgi:hypothetical protein
MWDQHCKVVIPAENALGHPVELFFGKSLFVVVVAYLIFSEKLTH